MQLELPADHRARALQLPRLAISEQALGRLMAAAVTLGVFGVYLSTLAPTVMWYDMGEFATASATLGIAHNTGYPLLILLGKAFTFIPAGDAAYRVNLMSATSTALAAGIVFATVRDHTRDPIAAAFGALLLAFASTVWANATWATSYGLNLFFTAAILKLMLDFRRRPSTRTLALAALALGLGLCNHRLIVLVVPPSLLILGAGRAALGRRALGLAALAFIAGLSVYAYLPIRGEQEPALSWARPADWHTYWSMFLNGQTPSDYWRWDVVERLDILWAYPAHDLTWAGLAIAALGLAACLARDRVVALSFALLLAADAAIVLTYSIHNVYNYLTPAYVALALLAGLGAARINAWARGASLDALRIRPALRSLAVAVALAAVPALLVARAYEDVDRSADYAAYDFATTTLDRLPDGAVVMTDSWSASPLWYAQLVERRRPDVLVSPIFSVPGDDPVAFARRQLDAGRPVYVADGLRASPAALEDGFIVQPVLLDGIEMMLTDALPRPQYRDALVPFGSLYRVTRAAPELRVPSVPGSARISLVLGDLTLVGFAATPARAGSVAEITYYWQAAHAVPDLTAVTTFATTSGVARERYGRPAWWQSREIGEGVLTTSAWRPGEIVRESYFTLIPRDTPPGDYDARITVFDPANPAASDAAIAGRITVLPR